MDTALSVLVASIPSLVAQSEGSKPLFPGPLVEVPDWFESLVAADMNRDGHLDVVGAVEWGLETTACVLLGDGRGGLTLSATSSSPWVNGGMNGISRAAVLDCDGDQLPDVVTSGRMSTLLVFQGDGRGGLSLPYG